MTRNAGGGLEEGSTCECGHDDLVVLADGDFREADWLRLGEGGVGGGGGAVAGLERDELEVADVGEHGEGGGLRRRLWLDVGADPALGGAVLGGDEGQPAGVVAELLDVVLHGPRHDAVHVPGVGEERRDDAVPVAERGAPARHLVGERGVGRGEERRDGLPDGGCGDPRRGQRAGADVGAELLPDALEGLEGEDDAVREGGGDDADLVGEEQAAEEVAVERLREIRGEEHLLWAAGIKLHVTRVGDEILVTVQVGGGRGRREATLGRELPARVIELQRLAVLDGESPVLLERSDIV